MFVTLRQGAEEKGHLLTLRTHLYMRTAASFGSYFVLSLMYTLIILAFSVPLTGKHRTSPRPVLSSQISLLNRFTETS